MPDQRPSGTVLAEDFRLLSDTLYATNDVAGALDAVTHLATRTIVHCDWAGISQATRGPAGRFATIAASDPVVEAADHLQDELQEGPALETVEADTLVYAEDLAATTRWPRFGGAISASTPIRSALSLTIHPAPVHAALNLYSATPGAFSAEAVDTATLFAAHAQVLLLLVQQSDRIAHLTDALTTSRMIGNAVGILMYAHRITSDEAFDRLTRASRDLNRRLFDLADEVTSTGRLPRPGHPRNAGASPAPSDPKARTTTQRGRLSSTRA